MAMPSPASKSNTMRRLVDQKDFLTQLILTSPTHPGGSDTVALPSCVLKEILVALKRECGNKYIAADANATTNSDTSDHTATYQHPRKRQRKEVSNNHHSIIRFLEKIVGQRYSSKDDDTFMEDEMQVFLGDDNVSHQDEEDVLCLVFEMALDAISKNAEENGLNLPDAIPNNAIIDAALRVIDWVVSIDRRERQKRLHLLRGDGNKRFQPLQMSSSRREKYQQLLANQPKRDNATIPNNVSVFEERYNDKWKWLKQFRQRYATATDNVLRTILASESGKAEQHETVRVELENGEGDAKSSFVILRRKSVNVDDLSLSSDDDDNDEKEEQESDAKLSSKKVDVTTSGKDSVDNETTETKSSSTSGELPSAPVSPLEKLDKEASELRLALLDMPPSELSSAPVVQHVTESIVKLLSRYGDVEGVSGILHCGEVIARGASDDSAPFPLTDTTVSSLVKEYLTDATGALRANAFLRAFVLPLLLGMQGGKPASRVLTSVLASLARDRPIECVESVLVPTLTGKREPSRFQCELIARVLRGKDALSVAAVALLVEKVLSTTGSTGGIKWTAHTMPLFTAALNRQPALSDDIVATLADQIAFHLSTNASPSLEKDMKFSTLFHAFVTKYGKQLSLVGKVVSLEECTTRLKTFMNKTISTTLKKL